MVALVLTQYLLVLSAQSFQVVNHFQSPALEIIRMTTITLC